MLKKILLSLFIVVLIAPEASAQVASIFNRRVINFINNNESEPFYRDTAVRFVRQHPGTAVEAAKTYCQAKDEGLDDEYIMEVAVNALSEDINSDEDLIVARAVATVLAAAFVVAPDYYCPQHSY